MTVQEWLASDDPEALLAWLTANKGPNDYYGGKPLGDRKLRLFAVACVRQHWSLLDAKSRRVVETAERFADGLASKDETFRLASDCMTIARCLMPTWDSSEEATAVIGMATIHNRAVLPTYAALLRDIVNPFRLLAYPCCEAVERIEDVPGDATTLVGGLCPIHGRTYHVKRWFTTQVLILAQAAYAGDWSALLPLADALDEAGCLGRHEWQKPPFKQYTAPCLNCGVEWATDEHRRVRDHCPHPLLAHLRSPGPHVRGCWAIDLIREHHD